VPGPLRVRGDAGQADLLALEEAEHLAHHEAITVEDTSGAGPGRRSDRSADRDAAGEEVRP
jgi:hypothetical protein